MNYINMTDDEIHDVIVDLVREIKKACVAEDRELVILVNGKKDGWFRIIDMNSAEVEG